MVEFLTAAVVVGVAGSWLCMKLASAQVLPSDSTSAPDARVWWS